METERAQLQARICGRVQGVGYRIFVRSHARDLGLAGFVRNAEDGSVEVLAEGARADLDRLLAALHAGPPGARTTDVTVRWGAATGAAPPQFEVRP
jgi:acylphosphatase